MEKSHLETKVGLFVFIGLVLLGLLLLQFSKSTSFFRGTYELHLRAGNVGGLKLRAGVLLAGVQVGSVSDIQLAADGKSVTILLKVYKQFKIFQDARFVIEQSGFLGDQFVSIIPTANQGGYLANNAEVNCQEPFNLQEVARGAAGFIQRLDGTAQKLDDAITDVRRLVLNEQTLTNISSAVVNLRDFSIQAQNTLANIDTLVATNGGEVSLAISNMVFFSQELDHMADNLSSLITTNSPDVSSAVQNIRSSTVSLKQLLDDLQSGKGLAGTLLQNEQLATNMQIIVNNLSVTTSNLNRLGLWGLLWHHEPLHTNAPAAAASGHD